MTTQDTQRDRDTNTQPSIGPRSEGSGTRTWTPQPAGATHVSDDSNGVSTVTVSHGVTALLLQLPPVSVTAVKPGKKLLPWTTIAKPPDTGLANTHRTTNAPQRHGNLLKPHSSEHAAQQH